MRKLPLFAACIALCSVVNANEVRLGDDFDPSLTNISRLVFWVDANTNCVTDANGAVTQWADVREIFENGVPTADHAFEYKRGLVYQPAEGSTDVGGLPPTFKTEARHPGMKFLDFGDYGSGRWMYLANPAGEILHQKAFTFYCVVGFDTANNAGHILSDVASLSAHSGGKVFFHKELGGSAAGRISCTTQDSSMYLGASYLDGERIDPTKTSWKWDRYQVFGQVGPSLVTNSANTTATNPYFSTLLNDRNIALGSGYRQGGAVIGELLVWNQILTEKERRHVEAYLRAKWFGVTHLGETEIPAGESLVVDNGPTNSVVDEVTGAGTLVKRGAGETTLRRYPAVEGAALRLEAGSLAVQGGRVEGLLVDPVPGTKLTMAEGRFDVTASAAANVAELSGHGVTVRPADLADKTLAVNGTVLRLADPSADVLEPEPLATRYPNLLRNGSFEEDRYADGGYGAFAAGWTLNGYATVGTKGSPWYDADSTGKGTGPVPDGRQFLAIQGRETSLGVVSQTFTAPVDGLYRLTFQMTRRTSRSETPGETVVLMSVDGTRFYRNCVFEDYRGDINVFKLYSAYLPPLKAGAHTLTLSIEDNSTKDRAVVLDDLRLYPVAEGEYVHVPNAGMDSVKNPVRTNGTNGYFWSDLVSDWTCSFLPSSSSGSWGVTQMSTYWNWKDSTEDPVLDDFRKAFLQMDTKMETTVTLPRDGRVRLSFTYANRSNRGYPEISGGARDTGHRVEAYLCSAEEDLLVAAALPTSPSVRGCQGTADLKAGTYTLRIVNNRQGVDKDLTVIVDDVRIVYEDSEPRIVPRRAVVNGNFWWQASGNVKFNRIASGAQEIVLPRGESVTHAVTVPSNGLYNVVLSAGGQETTPGDLCGGINFGTKFYPARFAVKLDDEVCGVTLFQDDDLRTQCAGTAYLTAGEHALQLLTVWTGTAEKGAVRVRDVDLRPATRIPAPAAAATKETRLRLAGDAKLVLDYEGAMTIREFAVNGRAYQGRISAQTEGLSAVLSGLGELVVVPRGTLVYIR